MKREFTRQAIHIAGGIFYAALFLAASKELALAAATGIFFIGILVSLSHRSGEKMPYVKSIIALAQREDENGIPGKGALAFTLGVLLTAIIFFGFDSKIIAGAILVLGIGDGTSTLIGKVFGKTKILQNRTLEGTIGGIIASAIVLAFIFPLQIAIFSAVIGMLAEYLPANDNYAVPLAAAAALAVLA